LGFAWAFAILLGGWVFEVVVVVVVVVVVEKGV
jgi:hypothetical protein